MTPAIETFQQSFERLSGDGLQGRDLLVAVSDLHPSAIWDDYEAAVMKLFAASNARAAERRATFAIVPPPARPPDPPA